MHVHLRLEVGEVDDAERSHPHPVRDDAEGLGGERTLAKPRMSVSVR